MPKTNLFRNTIATFATAGILLSSAALNVVHADAHLAGGDFMQAFNNTTQEGTWRDPISAAPGDVVEYRIHILNDGDQVAHHVQVFGSANGQVPQDPALTQVITGQIHWADFGGQLLSDTATVNITGNTPVGMRYFPGHARIQGVTNLYNCPSACPLTDSVLGGIEVGDIQPGQFVEVAFKAVVVGVAPSPTPTPTPTATPTSTPVVTPTPTPGTGGNTNNNNNTNCSNTSNGSGTSNACSSSSSSSSSATGGSVTINTTTTAPAPVVVTTAAAPSVKQLPQTGLPLAGLALGGLLPAGLKLKKFGKGSEDTEETSANNIWVDRMFKRS